MEGVKIMPNILIVEDDININNLLCEVLRKAGYTCEQAFSGTEAKLLLDIKEKAYTLVLLDLMLPGASGEEVLKEIRKQGRLPVIVLTAKDSMDDKIGVLTDGADDYITKPFSPNELVARVKAHLNRYIRLTRKRIDVNEYIEYPGLKIDKSARRVFVNEEERFFTTKEFDLLTYLATHPNHVFSKDELFSAVWGMDSMGEIATVTVHIKKIRKKTENANVKSGYIETVWGSGYRFRVIDSDVSGERESIVDAI